MNIHNAQNVRRKLMARPEMTASSEQSCYIRIGDYIVYLEVSEATEGKPLVTFWKKYWAYDKAVTLNS